MRGGSLNPAAQYAAVFSHAIDNFQQGGLKAAAVGVVQDSARATQKQLAPATAALGFANSIGLENVRVPYTPLTVGQANAALSITNAGLRNLRGGTRRYACSL